MSDYTGNEIMTVVAARALSSEDVTSFGYGAGGAHRRRLGITPRGPTRLITEELWVLRDLQERTRRAHAA